MGSSKMGIMNFTDDIPGALVTNAQSASWAQSASLA